MAAPEPVTEPATPSPETELKFLVSEEAVERLAGHRVLRSPERSERLRSIYFDTPRHELREAGLSLRVREAPGGFVQTIKRKAAPAGVARDEWERPAPRPEPTSLENTPVAEVLDGASDALTPIFVTDVKRSIRYWTQGEAVVEVSLDRGEIVADARREPILELELELKRGGPAALFELAQDLARVAPLRLSFESKGERGYRLAGHDGSVAYKADPAGVAPGLPVAQAFRAVARSCLAQISTNAELFMRRRNPEALHQLRVGLRRMRAAMSVFKDVLPDAESDRLKGEARWLSGELNAARDLDVFLQDTFRPSEQAREDPSDLAGLGKWLSLAQAKAYDRAVAAVGDERFCKLMLDLAAWIEAGDWASSADPQRAALLDCPVEHFAEPRLAALRRKVRKAGRRLAELDPVQRHELRIRTKKLRYATEFFGEAFEGAAARRRRSFLAALKGFQDALGGLNDIAVAERVAGEAVRQAGARLAFQAGVLAGARRNDEAPHRREAQACFKAFDHAKPFW